LIKNNSIISEIKLPIKLQPTVGSPRREINQSNQCISSELSWNRKILINCSVELSIIWNDRIFCWTL